MPKPKHEVEGKNKCQVANVQYAQKRGMRNKIYVNQGQFQSVDIIIYEIPKSPKVRGKGESNYPSNYSKDHYPGYRTNYNNRSHYNIYDKHGKMTIDVPHDEIGLVNDVCQIGMLLQNENQVFDQGKMSVHAFGT